MMFNTVRIHTGKVIKGACAYSSRPFQIQKATDLSSLLNIKNIFAAETERALLIGLFKVIKLLDYSHW